MFVLAYTRDLARELRSCESGIQHGCCQIYRNRFCVFVSGLELNCSRELERVDCGLETLFLLSMSSLSGNHCRATLQLNGRKDTSLYLASMTTDILSHALTCRKALSNVALRKPPLGLECACRRTPPRPSNLATGSPLALNPSSKYGQERSSSATGPRGSAARRDVWVIDGGGVTSRAFQHAGRRQIGRAPGSWIGRRPTSRLDSG